MRSALASMIAALATAGCYGPTREPCANGVLCAEGQACTGSLVEGSLCADEGNVAACAGAAQRDPCVRADSTGGVCVNNVCSACDPREFECRYAEWTRVSSPVTTLSGVYVEAPDRAYAVGAGSVVTYDGRAWTESPAPQGAPALVAVWSSGADVFVIAGTTVYRNGTAMTPVANTPLRNIWGASATDVIAVGDSLGYGELAASTWTWESDDLNFVNLNDVWGVGGSVLAVGADTILHRPPGATARVPITPPNALDELFGVWGTSPDDLYVVGSVGTSLTGVIHHYKDGTWSDVTPADVPKLVAIWGAGPSAIYAVGAQGTIVGYDGTTWSTLLAPDPVRADFVDISGSGTDAVAVASDGSIWRISPP